MRLRRRMVVVVVLVTALLVGVGAQVNEVYLPLVTNAAPLVPARGKCDDRPCEMPLPMSLLRIGFTPESLRLAICVVGDSFLICWPEQ